MSNSWPDCEGFKDEGSVFDDRDSEIFTAETASTSLDLEHWLKRNSGGFYLFISASGRCRVSAIKTKVYGNFIIRFFYLEGGQSRQVVVMWGDKEKPAGGRLYTLPPDAVTDTNYDFFLWSSWYGGPAFMEVGRGLSGFTPLVLHKEKSVCIAGDFGLTKTIDKRTGEIYWLVGDKQKNYHEILFKEGPKVSEPLKCELKETPTASGENQHRPAFQTAMGEENTPMGYINPPGIQDSLKLMSLQKELEWIEKLKQPQVTIQKTLEDLAKEVAGLRKLQVEHFNELSESIGEMYERNFSQELAEFSELMDEIPDMEDLAKVSPPFQMKDMHKLVTTTLIGMVRDAKEMSIQSFIEEFLKGAALRLKE